MTQIHWLDPVSGNFNTATDWSGGVVPGAADDAILDAAGSPFTVTITTSGTVDGVGLAANATLLVGTSFTATNGTDGGVNAGSILVSRRGRFVVGGALTNTGSILLFGGRSRHASATEIIKGSVTLEGGGTFSLTGASTIKGGGKGAVLTNVDNTISGGGSLGISSNTPRLAVNNEAGGVIDATSSHGLGLAYDRPSSNSGLMEATGGGVLLVVDTTIDNTGGRIEASSGGTVVITTLATVTGGAISSGAGSTVEVMGISTVTGATLSTAATGVLAISNLATVIAEGIVANAGTILLSPVNGTPRLIFDGNTTLTGGGTVECMATTITGTAKAVVLTNVDNTITGYGAVGNGALTLINQANGVIDANLDGLTLTIDTGAKTITNAGLIEATVGGSGVIESAIRNSGTLEALGGGTLTFNGAVSGSGTALVSGGTLDFTSSFNQNVIFSGTGSVLELAQSQAYGGVLHGFSKSGGATLDLTDIGFVDSGEATYSGTTTSGVLTVSDGTHTALIAFKGDYLNAVFNASSDGHGGTNIVATTPAVALARFVHAASTLLAGPPEAAAFAHEAWRAQPTVLAGPHARMA